MSKPKNDPHVYRVLAEEGYSNVSIAVKCGVSEASVRRGLTSIGYVRYLLPIENVGPRYDFDLDTPIVLRDENAVIAADLHNPVYSPVWVNRMIETARKEEIRTLVMGGDFFNFDSLSQYDPKQDDAGLQREWNEGLAVMRVLLETFDRIVYVWGNHDARLHKALGYKIRFTAAMEMVFGKLGREALERIEFTNLDHCYLEYGSDLSDPRHRWYVCHPQNYSRTPLATARRMSAKLGCNVITAHSHHCAVGYAEDGVHVVAEAGGLFDATKTAYLQRSNTFPKWQNGYSFIKDGQLSIVSGGWSTA